MRKIWHVGVATVLILPFFTLGAGHMKAIGAGQAPVAANSDGLTVNLTRVENNDVAEVLGMHIWKGTIVLDPSVTSVKAILEVSERGKAPIVQSSVEGKSEDSRTLPVRIGVFSQHVGDKNMTFTNVQIGGSSSTTSIPGSDAWAVEDYDGGPSMNDPSHRPLLVCGIKMHPVMSGPRGSRSASADDLPKNKGETAVFLHFVPVHAPVK